jgi:hypothetical protein
MAFHLRKLYPQTKMDQLSLLTQTLLHQGKRLNRKIFLEYQIKTGNDQQ